MLAREQKLQCTIVVQFPVYICTFWPNTSDFSKRVDSNLEIFSHNPSDGTLVTIDLDMYMIQIRGKLKAGDELDK